MELHELDPESRFTSRAEDYARCRPDYSDASVRAILEGYDRPLVADIGAGTGISSRRLAENGARVIAIEPNRAMIAAAASHPGVEFRVGTAEATTLDAQSVEIVTCFQAFHWFRAADAFEEFARVLKKGGRLALVWNERDEADPFTRRYGDAIRLASDNHPAENRLGASDALYETSLFSDVRHLRFRFDQRLNRDGLLGRATSASYVPNGGVAFEALRAELFSLHSEWCDEEGLVSLNYTTEVFLADKAAADRS